jgi:hypothetical protein
MIVLVEAISVIIKVSAIEEKFPGGIGNFEINIPNVPFCKDDELIMVEFMSPDDVGEYIATLEEHGLRYVKNDVALDMVVADQRTGFLVACDWAEVGTLSHDENPDMQVTACWLKNSDTGDLIAPDNWDYERSLSQTFSFTPLGQLEKSLTFLRHEDGDDVYLNRLTGRISYIGRSSNDKR